MIVHFDRHVTHLLILRFNVVLLYKFSMTTFWEYTS